MQGYVYILTNKTKKVLYIGVTSNLIKRVYEHKNKFIKGFTERYNVSMLVYFEIYTLVKDAITREKQLKGWRKEKKENLISAFNHEWNDLYEGLL